MREIEVWFFRAENALFYVSNFHGARQGKRVRQALSVGEALRRLRMDYDVVQVGIIPPPPLG